VFKYTTISNRLKSFHIRTAYADADINIDNYRTTTLSEGDEANDDETNQTEDEAAALETKGGVKMKKKKKKNFFISR
jgi:hypothetical protein